MFGDAQGIFWNMMLQLARNFQNGVHGIYLGVSAAHSSNVPLAFTIKTGSITPQYHVVFDDCISTAAAEAEEPQVWERLFTYNNQTWDQLDKDRILLSRLGLRGRSWR